LPAEKTSYQGRGLIENLLNNCCYYFSKTPQRFHQTIAIASMISMPVVGKTSTSKRDLIRLTK